MDAYMSSWMWKGVEAIESYIAPMLTAYLYQLSNVYRFAQADEMMHMHRDNAMLTLQRNKQMQILDYMWIIYLKK